MVITNKESKERATAKKDAEKKINKVTEAEYEKKVLELSKELTAEKIGEALRKEGIHSKEFKKKISQILREKGKYVNPDLKNVGEKLERIKKHHEANPQDKRSKREKDRVFSQRRKLNKYHKVE